MPIGSGLALRIKGKLRSLFDDLDDKPSHPQRERISRFLEGNVGKDHSLIALPLRSNLTRLVKCSIDDGNSFITVPSKYRCDNRDIFPTISGNFFNLEQLERIRTSRDSKLILDRRLSRDLQPLRSNRRSCLRSPRDV